MAEFESPFFSGLKRGISKMAPPEAGFYKRESKATISRIAGLCHGHLLENVMPFWENRVFDSDAPGLLHYFDRSGNLTSSDKSTWCQGRMAYTFSLLGLELDVEEERRRLWRQAADSARDMLIQHAWAGDGRWHYLCTQDGTVKDTHGSAFSDIFAMMGLFTRTLFSGQDRDLPLLRASLSTLTENLRNSGFAEFHHFNLDPAFEWHGPAMAAMGLVPLARQVLGAGPVSSLADWALQRILWQFANDDQQMLLEMTDSKGCFVDSDSGATANPGHALESMWFCLEEILYRGNESELDRALRIIRWAFEKGYDHENGGLFAFINPAGGPPPGRGRVAFGDRWDDKLWWVQAEAIYTLALAALLSDDPFFLRSLEKLQQWTFEHLPDPLYGEWFLSVSRDGRPRDTTKGNVFRSAFHVPRALLKTALLEKLEQSGT